MSINKKDVIALGVVSVSFKLFYALIIDTPRLVGGYAVALVLIALSFLPILLGISLLEKKHPGLEPNELMEQAVGSRARNAYYLLLSAFLLLSAALSVSEVIQVATFVALSEISRFWLNVATVGIVCLCALCGIRAVAGGSRVRMLCLPVLLGLMLVLQFKSLMPRWLLPILGDGFTLLLQESLPLSSVLTLLIPLWLLAGSGQVLRGIYLRVMFWALAAALFYSMLSPMMPYAPHTRFSRLDTLLANGRTGLSLQLTYMVTLYSGLLTSCCYCLSMASTLLHRCFPKVKERWFTLGGSICVLLLLLTPLSSEQGTRLVRACIWPILVIPLLAMSLTGAFKKRRSAHE